MTRVSSAGHHTKTSVFPKVGSLVDPQICLGTWALGHSNYSTGFGKYVITGDLDP